MATDDLTIAALGHPSAGGAPLDTLVAPGTTKLDAAPRSPADPSSVDVGSVVRGRFELESMIGEGGMGVVYRAVDRLHKEMQDRDPYVAIKILNADLKRHPSALIALQRETRKAQLLAHENIINVHSFDRDGSIVYMTMELLDGKSLRAFVAENAATGLPAAEAVPMIRSMAKALAYAHDNDIVHSDFKPANVFLTRKKQIKVLDFGLARANPTAQPGAGPLLETPALGGMTPAYASPAVLEGREPTPSDDVFALALVALELLTGRHPCNHERPDTAHLQTVKATPLPGLSRAQRRALMRALGIATAPCHGTAGEFLREFDGPSRAKRTVQGAAVAAAIALPIFAFFAPGRGGGPAIPFEDLAPEVRTRFESALTEGQKALSFGTAGINDALTYFATAYGLHPSNPRAIDGLKVVADRFLASVPDADKTARLQIFGLLYCNDYLKGYPPVAASCGRSLGDAQCAAIAASCQASDSERSK
jgi:serine/threonine protein kinase